MARESADREDLLREATALVERAEIIVSADDTSEREPVVAGFRRDGSASFFFGADPVYQFNSGGQLRRAFVAGQLVKAERGQLVALERRRSETAVELIRHELTAPQTTQLLAEMTDRLAELRDALQSGRFSTAGQVPPGADVVNRVLRWLTERPASVQIATSPRAG